MTLLGRLADLFGATAQAPPSEFYAGSDYSSGMPTTPSYDVRASMSTYAAFAWARACVESVCIDLSGLPIRAIKGTGSSARPAPDHPMLRLLEQPSERVTGHLFRQQLTLDLVLPGNAFSRILLAGSRPVSLLRMHPYRVEIVPDSDGQVKSYRYSGQGPIYSIPWDQVLHVRGASWEDSPESLFGSSAIQALHDDLLSERAIAEGTRKAASKGRPDALITPQDGTAWGATKVKEFADEIDRKFAERHGGVAVLGMPVKFDLAGWTPRDAEFPAQREGVREAVLAVFGVPPTRLQLPTANYAQSNSALEQYWQGLRGRARAIDDALTRIARMFPNSADVRIEHDFSGVTWLQMDRTERLARVKTWVDLGVDPAEAAEYEGFGDAPLPDARPESPVDEPEAVSRAALWLVSDLQPIRRAS